MDYRIIAQDLRFAADDVRCKGDEHQRGCAAGPEGEPADAIHTYDDMNFCASHSAFDNVYVPCVECRVIPVPADDDSRLCPDCS